MGLFLQINNFHPGGKSWSVSTGREALVQEEVELFNCRLSLVILPPTTRAKYKKTCEDLVAVQQSTSCRCREGLEAKESSCGVPQIVDYLLLQHRWGCEATGFTCRIGGFQCLWWINWHKHELAVLLPWNLSSSLLAL